MRRTIAILILAGLAATGVRSAHSADNELTPELMQSIEDMTRSLDSDVASKDAKAASGEARELLALLSQVEQHYAKKGDAPDAVGFSQKTQGYAAAVLKHVESNNFDAASDAVGELARSCKSCHNVYKKKT
jgi:cytochrome c556